MTASLLVLQRAWIAALQNPVPGPELAALLSSLSCGQRSPEEAFAVYVNNVRATLIQALEKSFPVTKRLMGQRLFGRAVLHSLKHFPPLFGDLARYGEHFSNSVQTVLDGQSELEARKIGAVAQCEWVLDQAARAPHEPALELSDLQRIPLESWPGLRLRLVSQAALLESESCVYKALTEATESDLGPELRFVVHPPSPPKAHYDPALAQRWLSVAGAERVEVHPLTPIAAQWLARVANDQSIEEATASTLERYPDFELLPLLVWLISTRALTVNN